MFRLDEMLSTKEKIIQKLESFSELELSQILKFANQIKKPTSSINQKTNLINDR
jgi:hypothetical protein